jgi:hypothetical protein
MNHAFDRTRVLLAVLLLASLGLRGDLLSIASDRQFLAKNPGPDVISREAARYQVLVASLPGSGVVGYLLEQAPSSYASLQFMLAQYALTPRLVVSGTGADYVIVGPEAGVADDGERGKASQDPRLAGFILYERFPNGMRVFRRSQ